MTMVPPKSAPSSIIHMSLPVRLHFASTALLSHALALALAQAFLAALISSSAPPYPSLYPSPLP